jgi:gamma-glutamyl-gamma-aminobutyraldehyde dehydrogenase
LNVFDRFAPHPANGKSQSNMKRILPETSGRSPNIGMSDAGDLDEPTRQAAWGIFFNHGQVCSAGSRLLVQKSIHEDLIRTDR